MIHGVYVATIEDGTPPPWFNESRMALLAKGDEEGDNELVVRTPATTRPLSLSNTSRKLVVKLLDSSMAAMATATVSREQSGFVRGRRIHDAVLAIESSAIASTIDDPEDGAMVFLDQRAAFPSVARNFVFFVLQAMGVPKFIINAIKKLYDNNWAQVSFGNSEVVEFQMLQGIRQGCPLSGTLWAILFDPVIRLLSKQVEYKCSRLSAYADDLALVLHSLRTCLPRLEAALAAMSSSTRLELNFDKTDCASLLEALRLHYQHHLHHRALLLHCQVRLLRQVPGNLGGAPC